MAIKSSSSSLLIGDWDAKILDPQKPIHPPSSLENAPLFTEFEAVDIPTFNNPHDVGHRLMYKSHQRIPAASSSRISMTQHQLGRRGGVLSHQGRHSYPVLASGRSQQLLKSLGHLAPDSSCSMQGHFLKHRHNHLHTRRSFIVQRTSQNEMHDLSDSKRKIYISGGNPFTTISGNRNATFGSMADRDFAPCVARWSIGIAESNQAYSSS